MASGLFANRCMVLVPTSKTPVAVQRPCTKRGTGYTFLDLRGIWAPLFWDLRGWEMCWEALSCDPLLSASICSPGCLRQPCGKLPHPSGKYVLPHLLQLIALPTEAAQRLNPTDPQGPSTPQRRDSPHLFNNDFTESSPCKALSPSRTMA